MADIRITPASSVLAFTSSLGFVETFTQDASGSITLQGSGSAGRTSLFAVDGANGRLFSIDDNLSGSLFSVNTAAGLPVIEAFADSTVVLGQYGQNALVVTGSNVGIGTATPTNKLDVVSTTGTSNIGIVSAVNSLGDINFRNSGYPLPRWTIRAGGAPNGSSGDLAFQRLAGSYAMVITSNLNVGIGTTTPTSRLK